MASLFGDKQRFAAEVGEFWGSTDQLRRVDLWAAGVWLTCDDEWAYVPQFCGDVEWELRWLASAPDLSLPAGADGPADAHRRFMAADDGSRERCWFLRWGPTTDNLSAHLFRAGDRLALTFEFWRAAHPRPEELGQVFVAELPKAELVGVLGQVLAALGCSPDAEPGAAADGGGVSAF